MATLDLACARLTVRVKTEELSALTAGETAAPPPASGPAPKVGSTVYWRDGTEAGRVEGEFHFDAEEESAGGRRCFRKALRPLKLGETEIRPENVAHLCVDAAALEAAPAP
jgi:hypothetical protein